MTKHEQRGGPYEALQGLWNAFLHKPTVPFLALMWRLRMYLGGAWMLGTRVFHLGELLCSIHWEENPLGRTTCSYTTRQTTAGRPCLASGCWLMTRHIDQEY